ncbi:Ionotropic receptor 93a-like 25, partial [Homarus americanus]
MVGLFMNGLADIGITNVFITIDRMDFMDFSAPFDTDRSCFITRVEPPLPRWLSLALPYQMVTWMALLGGLLTTSLFLYLLTRVLLDRNLGELDTFKTLPYSGLYVLGMHFRVSQSHTPVRTSTQVFVLFLWLYVIIITTGYSSNLTAFLTVTREPTGMETLRELYISKLPVLSNGNFFKSVMVNTKNFYVQELAKNYRAEYDMDKTHSTVQQGKGVSIQGLAFQEYVIATRYTTHGRPSIRIMKECFSDHSIALGLEKQSVLERKFNMVLNWIVEAGLVRRWFLDSLNLALEYARQDKKAKGNNGNTEEEDDDDDMMVRGTTARSIPLGIDHMQGIFFILVLLYSLSILVFLLEWLLA